MPSWSSSATASATSSCAGARRLSLTSGSSRPPPASSTRSTWNTWPGGADQGSRTARLLAFPDTLVGTDSHTTMINGLGVVGWGVGGIEAEAAMLGQPIDMVTPDVIGFKLYGELPRRRDRHRPDPDRHPDAAQEGRGREVCRVLWPGPGQPCRCPTGPRSPTWPPNTARPWASSRWTTRPCAICA